MVKLFRDPRAFQSVAQFLSVDDRMTLSCVHKHAPSVALPVHTFTLLPCHAICKGSDGAEIKSAANDRVFLPKYIRVQNRKDLERVLRVTDHGIKVVGSWILDCFHLLQEVIHTLDLSECEIEDVSMLSHIEHDLVLNDNLISDVAPLANVKKNLSLRNNYIVDASPLSRLRKNLDLRDNYILDARALRHIPGVQLQNNFIPGGQKQRLDFANQEHAIQVVAELQQEVEDPRLVGVLSRWLGVIPQIGGRQKKTK